MNYPTFLSTPQKRNKASIIAIIYLFCFVCFLGFLTTVGVTPCEKCLKDCHNGDFSIRYATDTACHDFCEVVLHKCE